MNRLILTGNNLTLDDLYEVVLGNRTVGIESSAMKRVEISSQILKEASKSSVLVYGLNRGVGWNKDRELDENLSEEYNHNLLNSHSSGIEPYCTDEEVRAMMLIRLNKALNGSSGMSAKTVKMYEYFLNSRIHPQVPKRGSIGEGDISTLSHIGLAFIGKGQVSYSGHIVDAMTALEAERIEPASLIQKDGLSIVSSNSQGEAMAALLIKEAANIIDVFNLTYCLSLEGLNGVWQPLNEQVNQLRKLPGQEKCAAQCRKFLEGSYLNELDEGRALQDPLSFRCSSAVSGAACDALDFVKRYVEIQINSPDDNPCILPDENKICGSQNFETLTLALGIEMLSTALCHMSKMSCNRMIKLTDPYFTKLHRFLAPSDTVIAYGTIQKAFTYLDAENRMLCNPSSIDFYSIAGNIEDHASNLPLAAYKSFKIIDNLRYILGIEVMHAAQAVDLRGDVNLGKYTGRMFKAFRETVPFLDSDRNLSDDIKKAYAFIKNLDTLTAKL